MSDIMTPLPFKEIINTILKAREKQRAVFGVPKAFYKEDSKALEIFGQCLEMPFGPAAGPHTQLAPNIIAAYYAGSRFFELKTVQTLDGKDLPVEKPCIYVPDEGYNVEWSTELRVEEAYEEYVKAWFAIKLIAKEFELGDPDGIIFNMSVGYDFEGISSPKIDRFIEGLKDASGTEIWQSCKEVALANLTRFSKVDEAYIEAVSPNICSSITLSTLHGCPSQEIERIAGYLIEKKGLHTFVKCNPTLLGYDYARKTLDQLGYSYLQFDDHHFKEDLQYEDAISMIQRLMMLARENNLTFGVKLTNTFPVDISQEELPGTEMYMSGRALYPLTIQLAARLSQAFAGQLPISFSGGADYWNSVKLFQAGIWPITLATNVLKPGGYQRFVQLGQSLSSCTWPTLSQVNTKSVDAMAQAALQDVRYKKERKNYKLIKAKSKLPILNCFLAPCQEACPIKQDIPDYVALVTEKRYEEALAVILNKNPLPFITGTLCHHRCMSHCTRKDYEESIQIREAKLLAAEKGFAGLIEQESSVFKDLVVKAFKQNSNAQVAIVGGGPAGLAAAYFLSRAGMKVSLFEQAKTLGGIVSQVIPEFRIDQKAIDRDIQLIKAMGVKVYCDTNIQDIEELKKQGFSYIVLAIGAWQPGVLILEEGQSLAVLEFLAQYKKASSQLHLGQQVVVIGGGNTAMDAARAALRVSGVTKVSLVYRRTRQYMPADEAEVELALKEGVVLYELLQPASLAQGQLCCIKMVLGDPDASGRRRPIATGEKVMIQADTVISAVGEQVDSCFYQQIGILLDLQGRVKVDAKTNQTNVNGVYLAGDGLRGPASVVEAIADARLVANAILDKEGLDIITDPIKIPNVYKETEIREKKGWLQLSQGAQEEGKRCLSCYVICENCVEVCPNRANVAIKVPGMRSTQILHLDYLCNECGNCANFCPYKEAPYKEKLTLFANNSDFINSSNAGFVVMDQKTWRIKLRLNGEVLLIKLNEPKDSGKIKETSVINFIQAILQDYDSLLIKDETV